MGQTTTLCTGPTFNPTDFIELIIVSQDNSLRAVLIFPLEKVQVQVEMQMKGCLKVREEILNSIYSSSSPVTKTQKHLI